MLDLLFLHPLNMDLCVLNMTTSQVLSAPEFVCKVTRDHTYVRWVRNGAFSHETIHTDPDVSRCHMFKQSFQAFQKRTWDR